MVLFNESLPGSIGIMERKMETTILCLGFRVMVPLLG